MNNAEREMMKRAKQAEAARQRYHRLTPDEKKDLYLKRTLAQKGKRQLEKELSDSGVQYQTPTHNAKYAIKNELNPSLDKSEQEMMKRAKQAEAALQRYHCLTPDEKKDLNLKRTLAQKRKRQREKELSELEQILRMTNDIFDDPEVTEQLREKRMRARWAEAARTRYQRMSSEERRHHNTKRRLRQTKGGDKPEPDDEASRIRLREQNIKKAEAARLRYHRMSAEEKKLYNQRRTEAFRLRRMEEEALLEISIERINGEALDRVQQIVVRNARRAEAARLRYQRMTPEQRKLYNQRRHAQKRKREQTSEGSIIEASGTGKRQRKKEHELLAKALLQYETFKADETQKVIQGEDISQQKKAQIEHKLADNGGVSNEHHAGLAIPTPASRMHSMFLIKTENEKLKN